MSDITPERIAELRRLAEAATPGLWELVPRQDNRDDPEPFVVFEWHESEYGRYPEKDSTLLGDEDAAYIAAANPQTMFALLDALEEARGTASACYGQEMCRGFRDTYEVVARERDQLRQELEEARKSVVGVEADWQSEYDRLRAELKLHQLNDRGQCPVCYTAGYEDAERELRSGCDHSIRQPEACVACLVAVLQAENERLRWFETAWNDEDGEHGPYMAWEDYQGIFKENERLRAALKDAAAWLSRLQQHYDPNNAENGAAVIARWAALAASPEQEGQ